MQKNQTFTSECHMEKFREEEFFQVFVHISTAYVHCYRTDIDEVIYPMDEDPTSLLEALDYFDEKMFDHLWEKILRRYPNTYTYCKSLAESLLLQQGKDLPIGRARFFQENSSEYLFFFLLLFVAIIRPSIIGATWKEPIPVMMFREP